MAISKYAVLVGCNYPNTRNELHGCVNDVLGMQKSLIQRFGFIGENIKLLIDTDATHTQPTGQNICHALVKMVQRAKPKDVLFFHYSGHGTLIPAKKSTGHAHDECIVPSDFNLLTDEDFRLIVNHVPLGATFTMVSDSCHSGGLIDKEKEQIGPHTVKLSRGVERTPGMSKFLPVDSLLKTLREKMGNAEIEVEHIRVALYHLYGEKASSKVKRFVNSLLEKSRDINESASTDHPRALQLLKQNLEKAHDSAEYAKAALDHVLKLGKDFVDKQQRIHADMGILLSGCQSNETSADASTTGESKLAFGAFTNAIQTVLEGHPDPITNRDLILGARKLLGEEGFSQHPCLYSSDQNAQAAFLCEESKK
eukprot:Gb_08837 [translate_table: standard]